LNLSFKTPMAVSKLQRRESELPEVRPDDDISANLQHVSWDFRESQTGADLHSIHPYPARFIPEIPRALINAIGIPAGTAVFDPFCGAGTTLAEAQSLGYETIGIDLNPIACLISRVKTTLLPERFVAVAMDCVLAAQTKTGVPIPQIPNLDHWFSPEPQDAIASLLSAFQDYEEPSELQDHLRVALSSILVRVSHQDSDTRYAAIPRSVSRADVFNLFLASCSRIATAKTHFGPSAPATVLQHDVLSVPRSAIKTPIGLVITSPPYPNAYEYWLYHKYRMWWLGFDPIAVKAREIGARPHFFKTSPATEEDFAVQMRTVLRLLCEVVVPGGSVCFVVGRSKIHGKDVDNGALITDAARELGMRSVFSAERTIAAHRKSFNLSHARIKTESVLVFRV